MPAREPAVTTRILTMSPMRMARRLGETPPVKRPAAPPVSVGRLAGSVHSDWLLICTSTMVVPEPPEVVHAHATLRIWPSATATSAAMSWPSLALVGMKPVRKPWMVRGSATWRA